MATAATACRARSPGTSRRTSSASTPKAASAARRRKARTATASTWWRCSWWRARHQGRRDPRVQSDGPAGQRFTLTEPWSLLLLDDERVIHETTPIQPVGGGGHPIRWC
jgi:hypothetical protein